MRGGNHVSADVRYDIAVISGGRAGVVIAGRVLDKAL
jgi:hypothetical protein